MRIPYTSPIALLCSTLLLFRYAAALQCAACSNNCPIKGQFLYTLDQVALKQDRIQTHYGPYGYAFHMRTTLKRFYTLPNHGHWNVWITPASADDGSVNIVIQSGEKFTTHYIITIYYTSPDVGIAKMDYYLDFPDTCNTLTSAISRPDDVIYVEIFQRADVAIRYQSCQWAHVAIPQMHLVTVFSDNNFRHNDLLYSADRKFEARHDFQHPLVKLSVATDQTEWNSYVFLIPHLDGKPPLTYWLRSGESCYYFLLPNDADKQAIISVFM